MPPRVAMQRDCVMPSACTTGASMRRSDPMQAAAALARFARIVRGTLIAIGIALTVAPAAAHKASDAYLQVEEGEAGLTIRWDIALRDLDAALDIDADGDGRLTWGEVRSAWP